MLKKIGLIKDLATKFGKRNTVELVNIVESEEPFTIDIKIKKKGIKGKTEKIILKDGQEVIIEYTGQ